MLEITSVLSWGQQWFSKCKAGMILKLDGDVGTATGHVIGLLSLCLIPLEPPMCLTL